MQLVSTLFLLLLQGCCLYDWQGSSSACAALQHVFHAWGSAMCLHQRCLVLWPCQHFMPQSAASSDLQYVTVPFGLLVMIMMDNFAGAVGCWTCCGSSQHPVI